MSRSRAPVLLAAALALLATGAAAGEAGWPRSVEWLRAYLRLDTSNPPGNEIRGALYLRGLLEKEGVEAEIFEPEPGRANLYARLRGTGREQGLLLHHHIDVVPASAAGWERPPFAAALFNDNLLYGRGVLDTKGLGIAQLEAFLALKRSGRSPCRDVVFLATADEERGGRLGVSAVFEERPAWLAGVGEVLGEGGDVETIVDRARWFGIEVQQKGALWLRLEAGGAGGHAASADESGPAVRVARAAARLAAMPRPVRLEPVLERQLTALARVRPPGQAASLRRIAADVARDPEGVRRQVTPWQKLLLSDTVAVTRLGTDSEAVNAHPRVAWAEVDVRLLPSTSPEAFLADAVKAIDDPGVKVTTLLSAKGEGASPEEGLYAVVRRVLESRFPGAVVAPVLGPGLSENRVFRSHGIRAYGALPFRVNYYDAAGIHGVNERMRVDWFAEGVETVTRIVREAAGAGQKPMR
ncbi:MAG TPA: M20/M25/M40 family metallo-hydrolase [Thermoanaerobaculia bacterium]|nr:M20/M25/M40 family metallo-hydrolase [Thermoanaerobaculia bacterium]